MENLEKFLNIEKESKDSQAPKVEEIKDPIPKMPVLPEKKPDRINCPEPSCRKSYRNNDTGRMWLEKHVKKMHPRFKSIPLARVGEKLTETDIQNFVSMGIPITTTEKPIDPNAIVYDTIGSEVMTRRKDFNEHMESIRNQSGPQVIENLTMPTSDLDTEQLTEIGVFVTYIVSKGAELVTQKIDRIPIVVDGLGSEVINEKENLKKEFRTIIIHEPRMKEVNRIVKARPALFAKIKIGTTLGFAGLKCIKSKKRWKAEQKLLKELKESQENNDGSVDKQFRVEDIKERIANEEEFNKKFHGKLAEIRRKLESKFAEVEATQKEEFLKENPFLAPEFSREIESDRHIYNLDPREEKIRENDLDLQAPNDPEGKI